MTEAQHRRDRRRCSASPRSLGTSRRPGQPSLGDAVRAGDRRASAERGARAKQLDAYQASLRRALARKPPALPAVPEGDRRAAGPARRLPPAAADRRRAAHPPRRRRLRARTTAVAAMTSHAGRLYALARRRSSSSSSPGRSIAAHPWGAAPHADPRLAALAAREARLRHEAMLVQQLVAQRWATYRVAARSCRRRADRSAARPRDAPLRRPRRLGPRREPAAADDHEDLLIAPHLPRDGHRDRAARRAPRAPTARSTPPRPSSTGSRRSSPASGRTRSSRG